MSFKPVFILTMTMFEANATFVETHLQKISGCESGFALNITALESSSAASVMECGSRCGANEGCLSVNVCGEEGGVSCTQLQYATVNACLGLEPRNSCTYIEVVNPCLNDGQYLQRQCICTLEFTDTFCERFYKDCTEASSEVASLTQVNHVIMRVQPDSAPTPPLVKCTIPWGGITQVFISQYYCSMNYDRPWSDYREGFGDVNCAYWIGLENLYKMLQQGQYQLNIAVAYDGASYDSVYDNFRLSDESQGYVIDYDSFNSHNGADDGFTFDGVIYECKGQRFSTFDSGTSTCPSSIGCGWWYKGDNCGNFQLFQPPESAPVSGLHLPR